MSMVRVTYKSWLDVSCGTCCNIKYEAIWKNKSRLILKNGLILYPWGYKKKSRSPHLISIYRYFK